MDMETLNFWDLVQSNLHDTLTQTARQLLRSWAESSLFTIPPPEGNRSVWLPLIEIFVDVITPVFALVAIGYIAAPRLGLDARTLSRTAYFVLIPAFVFNVMSTAQVDPAQTLRMVSFIALVYLAVALLGFGVAKLLRRSPEMVAAYVVVAVWGNVGNFGLPLIEFRLGQEALVAATIYFLAIILIAFSISVAAANWHRGGSARAILQVLKTPGLIALLPALFFNGLDIAPPLALSRISSLLGGAMVPIMLVTLGAQLAAAGRIRIDGDVLIASGIRLLGGPLLAVALAGFFGLGEIERGAGIFQAGMPVAILASIIALENKLLPDFVTTTVLFSTLLSVVTLTLLFALV
jgi:predicted permease